jgi:hypothetical protein
MSNEEEARALVDKFLMVDPNDKEHAWMSTSGAKACAIIAVDAIIKDHDNIVRWSNEKAFKFGVSRNLQGWKDIRNEIERIER